MSNQQRVLLFTYGGIAAAVAVLCVVAIIVFSSFSEEPETTQAEESVSTEVSYEEPEAETADAAAPNYTVKALPDGIGVFDAFGTLIRSFPVEVSTLPAADQNALRRGIDVTGKEALDKLLQDLTS